MKKKQIFDKTFKFYFDLVWDCNEEEFCNHYNKSHEFKIHNSFGFGKTVQTVEKEKINVTLWLKSPNNVETLAHELIHVTRYWLQDYQNISLTQETEEVYTLLHSFFMNECLKTLGLKKLTAI